MVWLKANLSLLLLGVLCQANYVHSQRIKDNMYTPVSGAHCFRRLNGTHVTGCSSTLGGSVGVLHFIHTADDIDFIVKKHPAPPYAPVLAPHLFTRENILRLRDEAGPELVSALVLINNASELHQYSQESRCPNEFSALSLSAGEERCSVERPLTSWNPWGTGLLLEEFPFPIYYIADPGEIAKLVDCYDRFNSFDLENQHTRSLCNIQVNAFMSAAVNSRVCLARSQVFNSMHPVRFCDPMQGKNVFATLFPRPVVDDIEHRQVDIHERFILVTSRMDTSTMFDGVGLGAMDSLVPYTVLLALGHFLAKVLPERPKPANPNVLFVFFNGESYDYIGSQRFVYDLQKGSFPTKGGLANPIGMENIDLLLDLGTLDDPGALRLYHASEMPGFVDRIARTMERINSALKLNVTLEQPPIRSRNLPPVSAHSFLRENSSFPAVIITSSPGNKFYHSIYDDAENLRYEYGNHSQEVDFTQLEDLSRAVERFPAGSVQLRLRNVSSLLGMVLYELITGQPYTPTFGTNAVLIDETLHCFLHSSDCPLFRAAARPDSPHPYPVPPTRYISVHQGGASEASIWTHRLLGLLVGQPVENITSKADCGPSPNTWFAGYLGLGECHRTMGNFSNALSPAFLDDEYDFRSGRYSTWTESTWRDMSARIFLRPSPSHETLTLTLGITVMLIAFVLVFLINSRSEVLFNQSSSTVPITTPTQC